jgi:two-component system, NtrC family, sensor histidine kinase PilS
MNAQPADHTWFGTLAAEVKASPGEESPEFVRLWHAFMAARLALGLTLVVLHSVLYATGTGYNGKLIVVSAAYFAITVMTRILASPWPLGGVFNRRWLGLVGADVLAILLLQHLQGNNINYTPLFALPILLASVLGNLRLALGTAAGVTVLLLSGTVFGFLGIQDAATSYVQAALSGVGYFAVALLASQLSARLALEGQRAQRSQMAVRIQQQVNELVIESLPDGVMIVDENGVVRGANPAARKLLGLSNPHAGQILNLKADPAWQSLLSITRISIGTGQPQEADITIRQQPQGDRRIRTRTRLAAPPDLGADSLCVLFLQDQREVEARMRTEKLASMGRMSTAVAHEIRNPLAAIAQANALLAEDLHDQHHQRLTTMVEQNTKRLEKIVDDILNVARIQPLGALPNSPHVRLASSMGQICQDWGLQNASADRLYWNTPLERQVVQFDADHLHRVLVNLLDNAARYASHSRDAIQVHCASVSDNQAAVSVWSDGAPMESSVERHLFEPFFSSESRSSGLGLYICRELCERHGGAISYQRNIRTKNGVPTPGNEFIVQLQLAESQLPLPLS